MTVSTVTTQITTAPSPADSGDTLTPASLSGFPDPATDGYFDIVLSPVRDPELSLVEVVRVTDETGGEWTIERTGSIDTGRVLSAAFSGVDERAAKKGVYQTRAQEVTATDYEVWWSEEMSAGELVEHLIVQKRTATLHQATVELSSADLLALDTTPIGVIPAPAANQAVLITFIFQAYTFGSTAYTATVSPGLRTPLGVEASMGNIVDETEDTIQIDANLINFATADVAGQPWRVEGDLADGDGTLKVTALYYVVDV